MTDVRGLVEHVQKFGFNLYGNSNPTEGLTVILLTFNRIIRGAFWKQTR